MRGEGSARQQCLGACTLNKSSHLISAKVANSTVCKTAAVAHDPMETNDNHCKPPPLPPKKTLLWGSGGNLPGCRHPSPPGFLAKQNSFAGPLAACCRPFSICLLAAMSKTIARLAQIMRAHGRTASALLMESGRCKSLQFPIQSATL